MAKRADANQPEIVHTLRQVGAWVWVLHAVGKGFPDLLVYFRGRFFLLEVKSAGGTLTSDERDWHGKYPGAAHIVRTPEQALIVIGAISEPVLLQAKGPM